MLTNIQDKICNTFIQYVWKRSVKIFTTLKDFDDLVQCTFFKCYVLRTFKQISFKSCDTHLDETQ